MFVKKNSCKNGRVLLVFTKGYRENGKVKHKNIETIGYLDDLQKIYPDPLAHFRAIAKQRTEEEEHVPIMINTKSKLTDGNTRKNMGYIFLQKLYYLLDIDGFLSKKHRKENVEYRLNDALRLLVYSRIQNPSSIKKAYENKDRYFEKFDFSLKDLYRSLDLLLSYKTELITHLNQAITSGIGRDASITYYDCTNYYFEINYSDEDITDENGNVIQKGLRKKGPEKNNRPDPIVMLGLLLDKNGIPMNYDIFPGNESEKLTLLPLLRETKKKFNLQKVVIVADKGLNTSDNIFYNNTDNSGYIYSKSIRGADSEFKDWALTPWEDMSIAKSRIHTFDITIERDEKRNTKYTVIQKQVVYYSQNYADRARNQRNETIRKANSLIKNPGKYNRATSVGAAGYVINLEFDKKTGVILERELKLDREKIKEEEKLDGYYAIVTSEVEMSDNEIIEAYKGLWRIEDSFRVTKTEFKARPVYLSTEDHIRAHFFVCYISLLIMRLLELQLDRKYSPNQIVETLENCACTYVEQNYYLFNYRNDLLKDLEAAFRVDLGQKYLRLSQIKQISSNSKK